MKQNRALNVALGLLLLMAGLSACREQAEVAHVTVIAKGLLNPLGLAALPDGGLLIAEEGTGRKDDSAGVTLITAERQIGRLVSGLPSSRDSGDLSGAPLVAVSPENDTIFIGHFNAGHLLSLPIAPDGPLQVPETPYSASQLVPRVEPLNRVMLVNPFDMTFSADGVPVVSDASANGVAREKLDGTTTFFHQFFELPNPVNEGQPIDPVPTGITRVESEYYVTLTGGCPFPAGGGQLVAIDENRNERIVRDGLNMPIDVALGPDGTLWLLEFARFTEDNPYAYCFTGDGYLPQSGRLSRLHPDGTWETVLDNLDFPGAVLPLADGSLYISEVFAGRVLRVTFGPDDAAPDAPPPLQAPVPATAGAATGAASPATELAATSPVGEWSFQNVAAAVGLDFEHGAFRHGLSADPPAMMGAGLCWLDYDNDGWHDLYLVNSYAAAERERWRHEQGDLPRNGLFRNQKGRFVDVSAGSGADLDRRGNGCVAADFNRDGWTDIYMTAYGPNALLWNNGDGTFSEGSVAAGVAVKGWSSAAVVGDLNQDGWPDLFVASYIDLEKTIPTPTGAFPQDYYGLPDFLFLNNGPDPESGLVAFRRVTAASGLLREERGLGALLSDFDDDGDLDLYIANDGHPNRLYGNEPWPGGAAADPQGLGFRFADLADSADVGDSGSGMGVAGGDYDGDGLFDLFVTNWDRELNALYRNQTAESGRLNFRYSTFRIGLAGLGANMTGWGTAWADFDHDTDLDLLVANGRVPVTDLANDPELVRFYGNQLVEGRPGQFREWTEQVGLKRVGPLMARGSAAADFDNDGDLDVAINTIGGPAVLLRNDGAPGNWLQIAFDGFYPGTVVTLTLPDGRALRREWHTGSSYLASEDPRLHFGLGSAPAAALVEVRWPDGEQTSLSDVPANQSILVAPVGR